MKKCNTCFIEKSIEEFRIQKKNTDGRRGICKECARKIEKNNYKRRNNYKPKKRTYNYTSKKCNTCSIEKPLEEFRIRKTNKDGRTGICKECAREKERTERITNPKPLSEKSKNYMINYNRRYSKKNYEENRLELLEKQKQYQKENQTKRVEYNNSYVKKRKKEDPLFHFIQGVRCNVSQSFIRGLKGITKTKKTEKILGCSIEDFIKYIESLFQEGMSFNNYGDWELDHIIPISSAKTKELVEKLCHHTNYQPLWWQENLKKGNKIIIE
jgi:hypothetical protein